MKKYDVVITNKAINDLLDIQKYIKYELKNTAAKKLIAKFKENIINLEELPYRHNLVDDEGLAIKGFRMIVVDNNMIFYIVDELKLQVMIFRVLYSRRNWKDLV